MGGVQCDFRCVMTVEVSRYFSGMVLKTLVTKNCNIDIKPQKSCCTNFLFIFRIL